MGKNVPILLYDNRCYLCTKFAKAAGLLAGGRLAMTGHYSERGEGLREMLGADALEMFWIIERDRAYGGRAALPRLAACLLSRGRGAKSRDEISERQCGKECRTVGAVFARSASLITHSRTIDLAGSGGAAE